MAVTINASTTSGLVMTSDLSGTLSLQSNGVAVTMPAVAGTMMVSGNMPAFSAYQSSAQTLSNATFTKMLFQTKEFDTNNNFANSTFTPTVAGYYQVSSQVYFGNTLGNNILQVNKNGGGYKRLFTAPNPADAGSGGGSCIVYCNGTTDYIEIYGYQSTGGSLTIPFTQSDLVWFQAVMVRAA